MNSRLAKQRDAYRQFKGSSWWETGSLKLREWSLLAFENSWVGSDTVREHLRVYPEILVDRAWVARRVHVAEIAKNAQAPDSQAHIPPRYDIMQANEYMMSGLAESILDKWFSGQAPKFSLEELGSVGEGRGDLTEVMERAREVANNPTGIEWQHVRSFDEITELI